MKEVLLKSYDIIKEEQRNADNKANIFIIFISAIIGFSSSIPMSTINVEHRDAVLVLYLFLLAPLVLFVWSLIPIYNGKFIFSGKSFSDDLNIFYWNTIYHYKTDMLFIEKFVESYKINSLEKIETDMLKQIFVNANILESKSFTHKIAFYILGHIVLIILLGFIAEFLIGYNLWILVLLILSELVYTDKIFKCSTKVTKWLKNLKR